MGRGVAHTPQICLATVANTGVCGDCGERKMCERVDRKKTERWTRKRVSIRGMRRR